MTRGSYFSAARQGILATLDNLPFWFILKIRGFTGFPDFWSGLCREVLAMKNSPRQTAAQDTAAAHAAAVARRAARQDDVARLAYLRNMDDSRVFIHVVDHLPLPAAPAALFCPRTGAVVGAGLAVYTGGLDWSEFDANAYTAEQAVDHMIRAEIGRCPTALVTLDSDLLVAVED